MGGATAGVGPTARCGTPATAPRGRLDRWGDTAARGALEGGEHSAGVGLERLGERRGPRIAERVPTEAQRREARVEGQRLHHRPAAVRSDRVALQVKLAQRAVPPQRRRYRRRPLRADQVVVEPAVGWRAARPGCVTIMWRCDMQSSHTCMSHTGSATTTTRGGVVAIDRGGARRVHGGRTAGARLHPHGPRLAFFSATHRSFLSVALASRALPSAAPPAGPKLLLRRLSSTSARLTRSASARATGPCGVSTSSLV